MEAVEHIRRDLAELKRRRIVALGTYVLIIIGFFGVLMMRSRGPVPYDASWLAAFSGLLLAALLCAVVTIGIPLLSRKVVYLSTGVAALLCVGALAVAMDPNLSPGPHPVGNGMPCFMYGTTVAAIAMAVLGLISSRVWRRFPNPGFLIALGTMGVGLAALHLHCSFQEPLHLFGFHLAPLAVIYLLAHRLVHKRNQLMADASRSL